MNKGIQITVNVLTQIVFFFVLIIINTYLNDNFIPDSFKWQDGVLRTDLTYYIILKILIVFIETVIFVAVLNSLNTQQKDKKFLKKVFILNYLLATISFALISTAIYRF